MYVRKSRRAQPGVDIEGSKSLCCVNQRDQHVWNLMISKAAKVLCCVDKRDQQAVVVSGDADERSIFRVQKAVISVRTDAPSQRKIE